MVEIKHAELNNSSHTFFLDLQDTFPIVLVLEWQDLWFAFWGQWMFPFADALLSWSCSVLVKDHMDLQTVARKEEGTEDFELFL